jgi:hypothetical protein
MLTNLVYPNHGNLTKIANAGDGWEDVDVTGSGDLK